MLWVLETKSNSLFVCTNLVILFLALVLKKGCDSGSQSGERMTTGCDRVVVNEINETEHWHCWPGLTGFPHKCKEVRIDCVSLFIVIDFTQINGESHKKSTFMQPHLCIKLFQQVKPRLTQCQCVWSVGGNQKCPTLKPFLSKCSSDHKTQPQQQTEVNAVNQTKEVRFLQINI